MKVIALTFQLANEDTAQMLQHFLYSSGKSQHPKNKFMRVWFFYQQPNNVTAESQHYAISLCNKRARTVELGLLKLVEVCSGVFKFTSAQSSGTEPGVRSASNPGLGSQKQLLPAANISPLEPNAQRFDSRYSQLSLPQFGSQEPPPEGGVTKQAVG